MAIYINGKLVAGGGSGGSSGNTPSSSSGGNVTYSGGGFVEMTQAIPVAERSDNTLYGLILEEYGG